VYAIVRAGSRQQKVAVGDVIEIDKTDVPVGETLTLPVVMTVDGDKVQGTCHANGQVIDPAIFDGTVDGPMVSFKVKSRKPVPLTMNLTMTANGDTMTGKAKPGMFGTFPVTGKRADW